MKIKRSNLFAWDIEDLLDTLNEDILMQQVNPIPKNKRGHLGLDDQDLKKVLKLIVCSHFYIISKTIYSQNKFNRYLPFPFLSYLWMH